MCKWGQTVLVKLKEVHKNVDVDSCIAPIVQALNDAGIQTAASCCGHGKFDGSIILEDGRELVIRHFRQGRPTNVDIVKLLERAAAYFNIYYEDDGKGEHWLARECRDMKALLEK